MFRRFGLAAGVGLLCSTLAVPAAANDDIAALPEAPIEEIVVTGSRIRRADYEGVAPVAVIDRAAIDRSGAATLNELFREVIYDTAGMVDEQFTQGFAPSSSGVNLRGLGVSRTLVLVDGKRQPVFPFAQDGSASFTDINLVPLGAVERVEILKDGASALYGADAIAGVVNIITRSRPDGVRFSARYSGTTEGDGEEAGVSLSGGWEFDATSVVLAFDVFDRQEVRARDRGLPSTANGPIDDRSLSGSPGTIIGPMGPQPDPRCPAENLRGPFCTYDFAPFNTLIPETQRISASAGLRHEFSADLAATARFSFIRNRAERDLAAAPGAYPIGATNPNNPFPGQDILAVYRVVELGPRRDRFETDAWNLNMGLEGSWEQWSWRLGGGYGDIDTEDRGVNGFATLASVQGAIDSGALNPFGDSPTFDPASIRYETERAGESELWHVDFEASRVLAEMRHGSLALALGGEYRDETFSDRFDPVTASGAVIGVGGTSAGGDRGVAAAFVELVVPVLADVEMQLAGRYDHYSDFGGTFNPKVGLRWQPLANLVLRANLGTGFKAPALHELYSGDITAFESVRDTTQCNTAQAAGDAAAITTFCDALVEVMTTASGNRNLDAEESLNFGAGLAWDATQNLSFGLDYWLIDNEDAVTSSPQFIVDNEASFATNVTRDGTGALASVASPFQNVATQEVWGIDADARGNWQFDRIGQLQATGVVSWLGEFDQQPSPGEQAEDLAGRDGMPEWRARSSLEWQRAGHGVVVSGNYVGGYQRADTDDVDAWTTFDLQYRWRPSFATGGEVALGADNVFDNGPPEDPLAEGWPFFNRALHDPRGRFVYVRYDHVFK